MAGAAARALTGGGGNAGASGEASGPFGVTAAMLGGSSNLALNASNIVGGFGRGNIAGNAMTQAQQAAQQAQAAGAGSSGEAQSSMSSIGNIASAVSNPKLGDAGFGNKLGTGSYSGGVETRGIMDAAPPKSRAQDMLGQSQMKASPTSEQAFSRPEGAIAGMFQPQQRQEELTFNPSKTI